MCLSNLNIRLVVALVCGCVTAAPAISAPTAPICERSLSKGPPLKVAYRDAPPFTYKSVNGQPDGFSVDLWRSVAAEICKETVFVQYPTIQAQEDALATGEINVSISPFTITSARLERYDFSQQYLSSGLTIAQTRAESINFGAALGVLWGSIAQPSMLRNILLFLGLNVVIALIFRTFLMRQRRDAHAANSKMSTGFGSVTLDAITRTLGLKGLTQELPSLSGRLFEVCLAVMGTLLSGAIFGVITTALVYAADERSTVPAQALTQMSVATLSGSTAQAFLYEQYERAAQKTLTDGPHTAPKSQKANPTLCPDPTASCDGTRILLTETWDQAIAALAAGDVEAVLGDWVALTYLSRSPLYKETLHVQPSVYRNEPFGWAISRRNTDPELARKINQALIVRMRQANWRRRVEGVLGPGPIAPH